jgi:serine/threonine-protein kinase RsbW
MTGTPPLAEVSVVADPTYVSVLRSTVAATLATLDVVLDDLDDMRLAVTEACSLLLPTGARDGLLTCTVRQEETVVLVSLTGPTAESELDRLDLAWVVLREVLHSLDVVEVGPGMTRFDLRIAPLAAHL